MIALLLLKQLIVLFVMMAMGLILVRSGRATAADSRVLSILCLYLILPCVIINAFQVRYTPAIRNGFLLAVLAGVVIHAVLFASTFVLSRIFHLDRVEQASIIYSNAANLIIPLVTALLGAKWVIYACGFLAVQTVFIWTHGVFLMSGETRFDLGKLLKNINLIAMAVGMVFFFGRIQLPDLVQTVLTDVSATVGPLSMIMIGMMLGETSFREIFLNKRLYLVTFLKMILVPGLVLLVLRFSGLAGLAPGGKKILMISLLAVITPVASAVTQLAQLYGNRPQYAGSINVMTTLCCLVTMPFMIALYAM